MAASIRKSTPREVGMRAEGQPGRHARAWRAPAPPARRDLPAAAAGVVRPQRPVAAMARNVGSVSHPRVRDHAAADAGRSRAAEISRVAREVSVVRGAGRRARGRRDGDVVSARLQHQAQTAAGDRARGGGALRRQLPSDEATLLSFKGIGAYTAGAIRSFAFRERAAILDTNVARVLFRVFIGSGVPKAHATKKHLWASRRRSCRASARSISIRR